MERKVAFITGASSGIGAALAREFAGRGFDVALVARRRDRVEALAHEIEKLGGRALAVECDVTADGDLERAAAESKAKLGRIDVVVANAGFGVVGRVERLQLEDYRRQFETNVFGVIRTLYATQAELCRTRGSFAITGSIYSYLAVSGTSPYAMSKFAVRAFADALRFELAAKGVSVTLLCPGLVESEIRKVDNKGRIRESTVRDIPSRFTMKASVAARQMAQAILKRRSERVITGHGKLAVSLKRFFPWLIPALFNLISPKGRRSES